MFRLVHRPRDGSCSQRTSKTSNLDDMGSLYVEVFGIENYLVGRCQNRSVDPDRAVIPPPSTVLEVGQCKVVIHGLDAEWSRVRTASVR